MSRSLTPSAYSPRRVKVDRRGRKGKENIWRGRKKRQDDLLTSLPRVSWGTTPHNLCPGQQCSRARQAASCGLRAESRLVSQDSGSPWGPSNQPSRCPSFIIGLDCLLSPALCWGQGLLTDEPSLYRPGACKPMRKWKEM